jgi:predicted AAA+ superfamily ATPase
MTNDYYIHQHLLDILLKIREPGKVLVIFGPRQIGKSTLLFHFLKSKTDYLMVSGDDINVQSYLSSQSIEQLRSFVGRHKWLIIDEAQRIKNIGLNLKLLVDHIPGLQIIVTGSSAFDLANRVGEPLTGRKLTFKLFPLSQIELSAIETSAETKANLADRLIYGSYPEVILQKDQQARKFYLRELVSSYLYKDILELDGIRKSEKLTKLLQLLAFQIGKDVSTSELGQQLSLNKGTVERYIDLLEKSFVLISLHGFSRNLRKEISKKSRYYFYDLGVRNAIISQFNAIETRNDTGQLWENYLVIERLKKQSYHSIFSNNYFWRTYSGQEIDWVEERDGKLFAFEFKWNAKANVKTPPIWQKEYPDAHFTVIHPENYLKFIRE